MQRSKISAVSSLRCKTLVRGIYRRSGEIAFYSPATHLSPRHEGLLTNLFTVRRKLFGEVYSALQPDYFDQMPAGSGVYVATTIPTNWIIANAVRPGDLDILIIPYEANELILDRVMVIEVKIIRASFLRQGKSPNEMGFSQASELLSLGFPHVAVVHLIVADQSPEQAWEPMMRTMVLDDEGHCGPLENILVDKMPINLMARAIGRLRTGRKIPAIGLATAFLGASDAELTQISREKGMWYPLATKGTKNVNTVPSALKAVANFFEKNSRLFLDTPRFDPL